MLLLLDLHRGCWWLGVCVCTVVHVRSSATRTRSMQHAARHAASSPSACVCASPSLPQFYHPRCFPSSCMMLMLVRHFLSFFMLDDPPPPSSLACWLLCSFIRIRTRTYKSWTSKLITGRSQQRNKNRSMRDDRASPPTLNMRAERMSFLLNLLSWTSKLISW